MAQWSELPPSDHIVEIMIRDQISFPDPIRFGVIYTSRRSSVVSAHCGSLPPDFPWLMVHTDRLVFLSLTDTGFKEYHLYLPQPPESRVDRWCFGSSNGWLMMMADDDQLRSGTRLLNPLTKQQIKLPHMPTIPEEEGLIFNRRPRNYFIEKAILSSAPTSDNLAITSFTVVAIHSFNSALIFCRPEDEAWSFIVDGRCIIRCKDVVFCEGLLYVLTIDLELLAVRFGNNSQPPTVTKVCSPSQSMKFLITQGTYKAYLVESAKELLLVIRIHILSPHESSYEDVLFFDVFKLDPCAPEWVSVSSLGDRTLFLSNSCSESLVVTDTSVYRRNHIYWTSDHFERQYLGFDFGMFCLEDRRMRTFLLNESNPNGSPPIWFMPSVS